ncbi:hypothetical protein I3843_14G038300 [Carya illinoinensis]|nr:hypothetical protein I3843_14G038300 [Carya illinoinensis]
MAFTAFWIALLVLPRAVHAKEYVVGDEEGWNLILDDHNVIVINATGYDKCLSPPNLGVFNSSNDRVTLTTLGDNYYICQWHCDFSDQKLMITVMRKQMLAPESSPALPPYGTNKHGRNLRGDYDFLND